MIDNKVDFRAAFEALPGSFLILQPDIPRYTILGVSDELLHITGRSREEVLGKSVFEVYPENSDTVTATSICSLRISLENVMQNRQQDQMPTFCYDLRNAAGVSEGRYCSANSKPVLDEEGEIAYIIHSAIDITGQVKARKKIEESEQQVRSFVESAPFPIAVYVGKELRIQLANQPMIEAYGKGQDVLGKLYSEVLPELSLEILERLEEVFITGIPFHKKNEHMEVVIEGKRKTFFYNYSFTPLYNAEGEVYGVMATAVDVTELNLARKEIAESESRFRQMLQQAPVGIALTRGREMVIESVNPPMQRFIGRGHEGSIIGKPLLQALPEFENQAILQVLHHVLESGEPFRGSEVPVSFLVGGSLEEFYFNISYTPLIEEAKISGILHVVIDVTKEVKARKKIEESAKELQSLANAMPQVVWIAEANGEVTFCNDRISAFEGAHKLPDGTWSWKGIIIPEDQQLTVEAWNKAVAEGNNYQVEHRLKMKDGTHRWHLSRAYPQKDEKGVVLKWYGTATDVHEQKENQEALRRSEEALRIAVEAAELGAYSFSPQFDKLSWSVKTKELFGLPPEAEINYDTFEKALHPEDKERSLATVRKALQPESGGLYENEFRILSYKDRKVRWLRSQGKVSFDAAGKAVKLTGVTQDITVRKQAEEALELKNLQLMRINNDLDNFIYTASHDLKAPISNIEGLMQALLRNLPQEALNSERVQRISGMMQESVDRFKKTIGNLTEVVKLQKENSGEAVPVNLPQVIQEVLLDLEQVIQSAGAEIEVDVAACPVILFSEKNLRSVVYNLLSNSIKYHAPDRVPRVQLHCESKAAYHVLRVTDNGLGMEKERIGQLFTMFKRFHAHVEGTGIGLYMIKKMIDNAGGRIEVESELGVGTTFSVYFKR